MVINGLSAVTSRQVGFEDVWLERKQLFILLSIFINL